MSPPQPGTLAPLTQLRTGHDLQAGSPLVRWDLGEVEDVGAQVGPRVLIEAIGVPFEPVGVEVAGAVEVSDLDGDVIEVRHSSSRPNAAESLVMSRDDFPQ